MLHDYKDHEHVLQQSNGKPKCADLEENDALRMRFASGQLALQYRVLASLYADVNDFHSVLDSLKKAQQADPASATSTQLAREIQSVEQYFAERGRTTDVTPLG